MENPSQTQNCSCSIVPNCCKIEFIETKGCSIGLGFGYPYRVMVEFAVRPYAAHAFRKTLLVIFLYALMYVMLYIVGKSRPRTARHNFDF